MRRDMEGFVLWVLLVFTGGSPQGGMFPSVQECQDALELVSKDPGVQAISECVEVRVRVIAPKT